MIDWDLEAPGLEKFFDIKNDSCKKGLLDMLLNYKKTMISEIIGSSVDIDSIDEPIIEPNEIKKLEWNSLPFLKPSDILIDIYPQSEGLGKLFLITAGMRSKDKFEDYSKAVVNFDWADFYKNWAGEYYFEKIRSEFENLADIILIDSRTGISETTGPCTYQLADAIIMFCGPNEQSITGSYAMLCNYKRPDVIRMRKDRQLDILVIPSRIDDKGELFVDEFYERYVETFRFHTPRKLDVGSDALWGLKIPHIPAYSFREIIAVKEKNKPHAEPLIKAFNKLANAMIQLSTFPEIFKMSPIEAFSLNLARILNRFSKESVSIIINFIINNERQIIDIVKFDEEDLKILFSLEQDNLIEIQKEQIILKPFFMRLREPRILNRTIHLLGGPKILDKETIGIYKKHLGTLFVPKEDIQDLFTIQKDVESVILLKPASPEKMKRKLIEISRSCDVNIDQEFLIGNRKIANEAFSKDAAKSLEKAIRIYKNIISKNLFFSTLEETKHSIVEDGPLNDFYLSALQYSILQLLFLRRFLDAKENIKFYLKHGGNRLWAVLRIGLIFQLEGDTNKAVRVLNNAKRKAKNSGNDRILALSTYYLGVIDRIKLDFDQALEKYDESLLIFKNLDDDYHEGVVLASKGVTLRLLNRIPEAMDNYRSAMNIFTILEEDFRMACAMGRLGTAYRIQSDYRAAIDNYNKSLKIFSDFSDVAHEASILKELGITFFVSGEWQKAEETLTKALLRIDNLENFSVHDQFRQAELRYLLSLTYLKANKIQDAINELYFALTAFRGLEDRYYECITLMSLATIFQIRKSYEKALDYFVEASLVIDDQEHLIKTKLFGKIGKLYSKIYKDNESIDFYKRALNEFDKMDHFNHSERGHILGEIGTIFRRMNCTQEATKYLEDALSVFKESKDIYNVSWILEELGQVYWMQDQYQKAISKYYESKELLAQNIGSSSDQMDEFLPLLMLEGKFKLAAKKYTEALIANQQRGDLVLEAKILMNLCLTYLQMRDLETSMEYARKALIIIRQLKDLENLGMTLIYMGQIYKKVNNLEASIRKINASIKIFRNLIKNRFLEIWALINLGNVYLEMEYWVEAEIAFKKVIEIDDNSSFAHLSLALCYKNMENRRKEYESEAMRAARLLELKYTSKYDFACLESVRGNFEVALRYLEDSLKSDELIKMLVQKDPHLRDLRNHPKFKKLMLDYIPLDHIDIVPFL